MSESPVADGNDQDSLSRERAYLRELDRKPFLSRIRGYVALSGPGWLQSALTLGGGSLTGSLYLGVLAGFSLLWLQPLAMILGIIMLSAIGYVTLSTGERPFRAINRHVSPLLGWGWLIASMLANMVWALPQYSLATGVMQQNLFPELFGPAGPLGDMTSKLIIVGGILVLSTAVTWSYGSGHWGVRLYERMLKILVALIVLCFVGVVVRLGTATESFDWGGLFAGFIPDFGAIFRPADTFEPLLSQLSDGSRDYWSNVIIDRQRDVMMTAFATAVGINMTFLLPYSMLGRGWGREHRGLAVFDLSTGMFIPFVLATSCVVAAAAHQFHAVPQSGLVELGEGISATPRQQTEFAGLLDARLRQKLQAENGTEPLDWNDPVWVGRLEEERSTLGEGERRLAATLVTRDVDMLSSALTPLLGRSFANVIFGIGVLGMALSTITLLMLVSGFVVCEVLNVPATGWPHRLGCLLATTGALGPFFWTKAAAWLAVPTSVFGLMLLPIAYVTFLLLMNQPRLLGDAMPRGGKRLVINVLLGVATGVAFFASGWAVWSKTGVYGIAGIVLFLAAVLAGMLRRTRD